MLIPPTLVRKGQYFCKMAPGIEQKILPNWPVEMLPLQFRSGNASKMYMRPSTIHWFKFAPPVLGDSTRMLFPHPS